MPPDQLLGYEVLVEIRIDGAPRATKQNAVCVSDGGASKPGSCPLEGACATGVDGGEAALGQVRCGRVVVELRSGPDGTRSITDGTSHLVDPRPLRILPNVAALRLANHD